MLLTVGVDLYPNLCYLLSQTTYVILWFYNRTVNWQLSFLKIAQYFVVLLHISAGCILLKYMINPKVKSSSCLDYLDSAWFELLRERRPDLECVLGLRLLVLVVLGHGLSYSQRLAADTTSDLRYSVWPPIQQLASDTAPGLSPSLCFSKDWPLF